ncbi:MAG: TadE/TadG family type IV pilus assembly protein [Acidimicrobiia bacterium]
MSEANRSTRPGHGARHRGQATVELALGLPIVCIGVLLVLQLALVGRDAVLVTHAAREAARSAAVEATGPAARAGALASTTALDPHRLDVRLRRSAGRVTAEVRYRSITGLPMVGALIPDPELRSEVTMLEEG